MRTPQEHSDDSIFWNNIKLIQETLGANEHSLAEELGLNASKFIFYKNNELSVPFVNVKSFSDKIGINADALLQSNISSKQLEQAVSINWPSRIPEKYLTGMGSKSFTVRHILKIAKRHGVLEKTCAHFGIHKFAFETKVDFPISVQLASDILEFIALSADLKTEELSELGLLNCIYLKDTVFGHYLGQAQDLTDLYERFLGVVNNLEENWSYKIQFVDEEKVIINSYPSERLSETYKRRDYSSYTFTKFRSHVGAHLTRYIGKVGAIPTVTKSIHHGDSFCQFNINFKNLKPLSP